MASRPNLDETRRALPTQVRAVETVRRILDVSAQLLIEEGIEHFTTNAVAQASDVNISTLYRYFPDKKAILVELYRERNERVINYVAATMDAFVATASVRQWYTDTLRHTVALGQDSPIGPVLHQVFQVMPDLLNTEVEFIHKCTAIVLDAMVRRFSNLSSDRLHAVAGYMMVTTTSFEIALRDPAFATTPGLEAEMANAVSAYLESLEAENAAADESSGRA